jgi:glycine cleavage system aminomethyltransferase T/glycine/D-amino acid oxidase-like deaminating enzyme
MTQNLPKAKVAVIGAGIVGNSIVYHLAEKGWKDIVLIDKGPLPNPGGSTGHASNFIFPVDHSKEMTHLTRDSINTYTEMGVYTMSGGIELARTEDRMQEIERRITSAKAWGEEGWAVTPEEIKEMVPWVNTDELLGGFYAPAAGVCDPLQAGTIMRQRAQALDALTIMANTEVEDIIVEDGVVKSVQLDKGYLEAEYVIIATGVWSTLLADMAGVHIPLAPIVHQFMTVGPVPQFAETTGEINFPLVRDVDANMYERQNGSDMEIGSYCHRTIIHPAEDIPSNEEATMTPTELPFTEDDFDESLEIAMGLVGEILETEGVGVRHAINGLMSLTPDGAPIIGETPEVKNLWSVAAIWIKEAPGFGRMVAEWLVDGVTEVDITASDINRFYEHNRSQYHVEARVYETFNKMYSIVHPAEQYASSRMIRLSPFYPREEALGAFFYETAGWERPHWYEANKNLLEKYGDRTMPRTGEWDARWWSPIINAEHLHMRENVGMVDLTAFSIFDVTGPGAADTMQKMAMNQMKVKVGRSVYTPILNEHGGFKADLTVLRKGKDHYQIVTGGGNGNVDKKWFTDHLPTDGSVTLHDVTSAICTVGLWGPKAREVLEKVANIDVSNEAFPYGAVKTFMINQIEVTAFRISYVGELGWEIYTKMEQGLPLWDILWNAGQDQNVIAVGNGVYGTTARIEKGYRAFGMELESDYDPVEAGLSRPKVKSADFIGKDAYVKAHAGTPAAILCTLSVDDPAEATGEARYMLGNEPILTLDGESIIDSKGRRSYATSAGNGPSIGEKGKHLLMGYLPPAHATVGEKLLVQYLGAQHKVTVEVAGSTPLFDPTDSRMKS